MNIKRIPLLGLTMAGALSLAACAPAMTGPGVSTSRTAYTTSQSAQPASVYYGVIVEHRNVAVRDDGAEAIGAVVGGLAGGLVGNQIGGGSGRTILTGAGAIAGATAGANVARNRETMLTHEWVVRLENGRQLAIVQNEAFRVGQQVRVNIDRNGVARIVPR